MSDSFKKYLNDNASKVPQAPRDELAALRERISKTSSGYGFRWWYSFLPIAGAALGLAIVLQTQQPTPTQVAVSYDEEAYVYETYDQFEELMQEALSEENLEESEIVFL